VQADQCRPGYTELFVKLSAAALQKHPVLLDQWIDERIAPPDGIHIAVAVATPHGLVTPVIRDAPHLSLRELSGTFAQLVELARTQRLSVEQMRGGAFTVSSLGGYRVDAFTPILNPPQTAILGVGRISEQPVVREKQLAVAEVVSLSLTFDHRVVDGAPAAAFLTTLCEMIERPLGWLLA
jgi:pyruvate dehydrogenase E2 component (dihydrolipoamide acetyltransferase)